MKSNTNEMEEIGEKSEKTTSNSNTKRKIQADEFPYLFPFHLATESASLKVYY